MGRQVIFYEPHHSNASIMEEWDMTENPKWEVSCFHKIWVRWKLKKMCMLSSISDRYIEHLAGLCQFLFCRFDHVRFLLWNTNHENSIIFKGQPEFHKVLRNILWEVSMRSSTKPRYISLIKTLVFPFLTCHTMLSLSSVFKILAYFISQIVLLHWAASDSSRPSSLADFYLGIAPCHPWMTCAQ